MLYRWDDLQFFLERHRMGSHLAAARRLGVSHTTVARHIKRLETDLGVTLFEPRGEEQVLTAAGQEVLVLSLRMEEAGSVIADRVATQGAVAGTIRIGAPDGLGNAWLAQVLPQLSMMQPDLEIELVPVPRAHKLWRRDVDIAISLEPPQTGRIVRRRLTEYDLRLYGAKSLLNEVKPQRVEDLKNMPFVGYIDELLYTDELDFNPQILPDLHAKYRAATVQAQLEAVRAGAGLGMLPCYMARGRGLLAVLPEEVGFRRAYWLLVPEELRDVARIRVVVDFITQAFRKDARIFRYVG